MSIVVRPALLFAGMLACKTVAPARPPGAYPYKLQVHYSRRPATGDAMGAVHVLEHDGHGRLGAVTLPFVLMRGGAELDVGTIAGPLITD